MNNIYKQPAPKKRKDVLFYNERDSNESRQPEHDHLKIFNKIMEPSLSALPKQTNSAKNVLVVLHIYLDNWKFNEIERGKLN